MKIVVGLGNPGRNYAQNRHNIGFRVIDYLAQKYNIHIVQNIAKAKVGKGKIDDQDAMLAKPKTYVNNSGLAVSGLMQKYKLTASDIIVVHDDLDMPLGHIRVRPHGSSGGHKGLKSIIVETGSSDFSRVKIGIGRPDEGQGRRATEDEIVSYVLSDFSADEEKTVHDGVILAVEAIESIMAQGMATTMNRFNKAKTKKSNSTAKNS